MTNIYSFNTVTTMETNNGTIISILENITSGPLPFRSNDLIIGDSYLIEWKNDNNPDNHFKLKAQYIGYIKNMNNSLIQSPISTNMVYSYCVFRINEVFLDSDFIRLNKISTGGVNAAYNGCLSIYTCNNESKTDWNVYKSVKAKIEDAVINRIIDKDRKEELDNKLDINVTDIKEYAKSFIGRG